MEMRGAQEASAPNTCAAVHRIEEHSALLAASEQLGGFEDGHVSYRYTTAMKKPTQTMGPCELILVAVGGMPLKVDVPRSGAIDCGRCSWAPRSHSQSHCWSGPDCSFGVRGSCSTSIRPSTRAICSRRGGDVRSSTARDARAANRCPERELRHASLSS
jgi:hypothetical protein